MNNMFNLENRTILITGASSGIGRAAAIICAQQGAHVVITGRNQERLKEVAEIIGDSNCSEFIVDLTNEDQLTDLVNSLPQLDGLVLCAGVNEVSPLKFATRKKIDSIFEINLFSQVELLRLILKKKKLLRQSSVVAISSIGGNEAFSIGQAAYGASKAALLSWMKFAAKELASQEIRVNCILPGHIDTPMNENLAFTAEQLKEYEKTIPLKRFGTPNDVANGIVFLLSEEASWITGATIKIDGGTTL